MKFYRVHYHRDGGNSSGFTWHSSRREAEGFAKEAVKNDPEEYEGSDPPNIYEVDVQPTKQGILSALNTYASHADND